MKNQIFTSAALSLCLLAVPSWAMDKDADIGLNKAARLVVRPTGTPAATVEDADDSVSSSSSDSESDNAQVADKKSKKFFVYIANHEAAYTYKHIVSSHNFSVKDFKRDHVKDLSISGAEKFLAENRTVRKLCRIMKGALKKFGATQTLRTVRGNRFIVELTAREEQSAQAVTSHCQKSDYVYKVFSDEAELNEYVEPSTASSSSSASLESALIGAFQGIGITMRPVNPNDPMFGVSAHGQTEGNEDRSLGGRDGAASSSTANPFPQSEGTGSSDRTLWAQVFGRSE